MFSSFRLTWFAVPDPSSLGTPPSKRKRAQGGLARRHLLTRGHVARQLETTPDTRGVRFPEPSKIVSPEHRRTCSKNGSGLDLPWPKKCSTNGPGRICLANSDPRKTVQRGPQKGPNTVNKCSTSRTGCSWSFGPFGDCCRPFLGSLCYLPSLCGKSSVAQPSDMFKSNGPQRSQNGPKR